MESVKINLLMLSRSSRLGLETNRKPVLQAGDAPALLHQLHHCFPCKVTTHNVPPGIFFQTVLSLVPPLPRQLDRFRCTRVKM